MMTDFIFLLTDETNNTFEIFLLRSSSREHWLFLPACMNHMLWHLLFICQLSHLQGYSLILKTDQLLEIVWHYLALAVYQMSIMFILLTTDPFFQNHCVTVNRSLLLIWQQEFNFLATDHRQLSIHQTNLKLFCQPQLKAGAIQVPFLPVFFHKFLLPIIWNKDVFLPLQTSSILFAWIV